MAAKLLSLERWQRFPRGQWLSGLVLALLTVAAYFPALRAGFIWDDDDYVVLNQTLRDVSGLGQIWFKVGAVPQYYPMVHTFFWFEYHVWGLNPFGYHLVNVLLHALAAVLLWRLLARLQVPGAWIAAAIFAIHPVQVESVAWITERKNVLSTVLYLAAALAYVRFMESEDRGALNTSRWSSYCVALIAFIGAILSKTVACSLPAALLLTSWRKKGRVRWRDVWPLLPFFTIGASVGLLTAWVEKHYVGAQGAEWSLSLLQRFLVAGRALCFYVAKLVWPTRLTFIYPRWEIDPGVWWQWAFPIAAAAIVIVLWLERRRLGRGPLVAVLFFIGTLIPALGFVNIYPFRFSFVADHFQYLASAGLIALAGAGLSRLPRVAWIGLLAILALLTWRQANIYRDLYTLWHDTLLKNPRCWMAHSELGLVLEGQGRITEATAHYRQALELKPDSVEALVNLGNAQSRNGQMEEAIATFRAAVDVDPGYPPALNNLGNALAFQGKFDEAIANYQAAVQISPDNAETHFCLAYALAKSGRPDQAVMHLKEALRLKPNFPEAQRQLRALGVTLTE